MTYQALGSVIFNSLLKTKVYRVSDKYAKVNNVDTFIQTILNCI